MLEWNRGEENIGASGVAETEGKVEVKGGVRVGRLVVLGIERIDS